MNHIDQEIQYVRPLNGLEDIFPIQSFAFVVLSIFPTPHSHFQNEHFARLGEQDWGLSANHPDILIRLHDAFDPRQG